MIKLFGVFQIWIKTRKWYDEINRCCLWWNSSPSTY